MLEVGTKAPNFTLPDQNGEMHSLEDYTGQKVILYFYPKDNTAGCTKQACGFAERYPQIQEKGAALLSDPAHKVLELYGAWGEKKNYGKVSMGTIRTTYLIDEEGIIIKAMGKVKAADNPAQMLEALS